MCPHLLNVQPLAIAGLLEAIPGAPVGHHPLDLFLTSPIGFNVVAVPCCRDFNAMDVCVLRIVSFRLLYRRFS